MSSTDRGRSVTFVGHDASRTGAPQLLASALRWITTHVDDPGDLSLVLLDGGPMVDEFAALVPTRVVGPGVRRRRRIADGIASVGGPERLARLVAAPSRLDRPGRIGADVVAACTLVSLPFAARLAARRRGRPAARLVSYVCELDGVGERVLPDPVVRDRLVSSVDGFIATGAPVADMLVERWGAPKHKVTTVDPWIDLPSPGTGDVGPSSGADPGPEPDRRPVVVAVGSRTHRKGPDRFVDLMSVLSSHPTRPVGMWVGGSSDSVVGREMLEDVARSVDPGCVRLVAEVADTAPLVASATVAVSTAIEDPFPLVVLEAAAAGVPVVGFDSGGIHDALDTVGQADGLVPVDDVLGLAAVIGRLLGDPAECRRRGAALSAWVRGSHLTEHLVPAWWDAVMG